MAENPIDDAIFSPLVLRRKQIYEISIWKETEKCCRFLFLLFEWETRVSWVLTALHKLLSPFKKGEKLMRRMEFNRERNPNINKSHHRPSRDEAEKDVSATDKNAKCIFRSGNSSSVDDDIGLKHTTSDEHKKKKKMKEK